MDQIIKMYFVMTNLIDEESVELDLYKAEILKLRPLPVGSFNTVDEMKVLLRE
jgi:hypothetical protein